jgi:hypothetical protein
LTGSIFSCKKQAPLNLKRLRMNWKKWLVLH